MARPRPSLTTSNMPGVTGDGIFMAEAVGAELVDMDQIQLLPFCNPQTGATFDITSANCFINKNGERFVREDGRRDEMAKAMIAQPEGLVYYIFSCEDPTRCTAWASRRSSTIWTTISTAT